jgi:AcrR family transcriptional regulator
MSQADGEGRRDRRKRENHARIYDAARRLFLAQGVDATTVEQIAATADIAPATFFNHFPSKRAVLNEMTSEVFAFLGFAIEQQLKASGGTRERLTRLAAEAADGIGESRGLAREVLLELVRSTARPGDVPPYLERVPAEKKRHGIPAENTVDISLIVGHPKSKFVKGIQRPVETTWI